MKIRSADGEKVFSVGAASDKAYRKDVVLST
jgi:hypothetical protein